MAERFEVHVSAEGRRVDQFLAHKLPGHSRSFLQKLIDDGEVTVDGAVVRRSHRLHAGDRVELVVPPPIRADVIPEDIPVDIVYQDADIVLVNKARGMVVHPNTHDVSGTLVNGLLHHVTDLSGINGVERPGIVHRIDKDTTGILVVAKNDHAHRTLSEQFRDHSIDRRYVALCWGRPQPLQGTVESTIGRAKKDRRRQTSWSPVTPRDSVTHYTVVEEYGPASMVQCELETGRTHQIRVHFTERLRHPLIGDPVYGGLAKGLMPADPELKRVLSPIRGQLLHAATLGFIHPSTGEYVAFAAPPPEHMMDAIRALRIHAGLDVDAPGPWVL
jgi:23S rRNA pseudouridine1911/1915/1917 synthase